MINNVQRSESAPVFQNIAHKINGPFLISLQGDQDRVCRVIPDSTAHSPGEAEALFDIYSSNFARSQVRMQLLHQANDFLATLARGPHYRFNSLLHHYVFCRHLLLVVKATSRAAYDFTRLRTAYTIFPKNILQALLYKRRRQNFFSRSLMISISRL